MRNRAATGCNLATARATACKAVKKARRPRCAIVPTLANAFSLMTSCVDISLMWTSVTRHSRLVTSRKTTSLVQRYKHKQFPGYCSQVTCNFRDVFFLGFSSETEVVFLNETIGDGVQLYMFIENSYWSVLLFLHEFRLIQTSIIMSTTVINKCE